LNNANKTSESGAASTQNKRQNISSGTVWEGIVGYSRAVRIGNIIAVAGTTATDDDGNVVGESDPYTQTVFIIRKIERALHAAGATLNDVIRTRVFLTNVDDWEEVGRAHGEFFSEIRPANTMLEISKLIGDGYLVEIEVDAVVSDESP
jgi:enamine deaminase RidA (YjgF/YER057c/UK114 family)